VSWLALLEVMFGMLRLNAWHPHFLPFTVIFDRAGGYDDDRELHMFQYRARPEYDLF
jgi:hypothetical protein